LGRQWLKKSIPEIKVIAFNHPGIKETISKAIQDKQPILVEKVKCSMNQEFLEYLESIWDKSFNKIFF